MFENYPDLMTPEEARKALGIGRTTMYRLLRDGAIKHMRIGRMVKIPKRYLLDYIEEESYSGHATANNPIMPPKEVSSYGRKFADFS